MRRRKKIVIFFLFFGMIGIAAAAGLYFGNRADPGSALANVSTVLPDPTPTPGGVAGVAEAPTPGPSASPAPSATPSPVVTPKPTPTPTPTPRRTPTQTPTPVPTPTPEPTPTMTPITTPTPVTTTTATTTPSSTDPGTTDPASTTGPGSSTDPVGLALPYTATTFIGQTNWKAVWGNMTIDTDGFMELSAAPDGTGATVLLNGSGSWHDYTVSATAQLVQGETISLIGYYEDGQNYVHCFFDRTSNETMTIDLDQSVNGNQIQLAEGRINSAGDLLSNDADLTLAMNGTIASCSLDDHAITSQGTGYGLYPPFSGEAGISIWDPNAGNARAIIKQVSVTKAVNPQ